MAPPLPERTIFRGGHGGLSPELKNCPDASPPRENGEELTLQPGTGGRRPECMQNIRCDCSRAFDLMFLYAIVWTAGTVSRRESFRGSGLSSPQEKNIGRFHAAALRSSICQF